MLAEREVLPAAGVERDFNTGASSGLHIWVQKDVLQLLVQAVDIVGQVTTDCSQTSPALKFDMTFL